MKQMRRIAWVLAIVASVAFVLAGCMKKDAGSIVKDLDHKMEKMESYAASGTMRLNTGIQPQEYQVEVWYQKENYYRIALTNEKKDISQIVLRNDDGVFVLTPHLNKSFRFQSDWPENQGQVYLYQSLVQSIVLDNDRHFTADGDAYVFDVLANYQNASLVRQKIWLDKKTYAPQHVEVSDANANPLVVMNFTSFEFDKKFDKDSFDMQRNMTGGIMSLPTMGQAKDGKADAGKAETGKAGADKTKPSAVSTSFGVIEPAYTPQGVKQLSASEIKLGDSQGVLLRYAGAYAYTLVESRPNEQPVSMMSGTIVDLGYTLGVMSGDDKRTLTWMYDGIEFKLSSGDLPKEEMTKIAMAVEEQPAK